jgi:hypothetical protein
MIAYYKNNEIDRVQWDSCVKNSPGVKPYAYSWYLDIMVPGWEALVDDDYDSVFPVPCNSLFGLQYVSTPVFLQQLGAFSPDKSPSNAINEFLDYMPGFYKLIDLGIGQETKHEGFKVTEKVNYELDLTKSYEKIWENFSPVCRKNIEASAKKKPELVTDITPDEILDLFIRNKEKEIRGIKLGEYERLKTLVNFCLKNKKGKIIGVRAGKKKLIFGIFIIETNGNKTLLFAVNTPQSRERHIDYFVINELIRTHSSSRTKIDFAGSPVPSIASFIQSFGSAVVPYYRIYRNRLLWPARMIK